MEPRFVDCHSHVVPSGDDGAKSVQDGLELCDLAAASGAAPTSGYGRALGSS
jgi:tyrosine-protein phosphatase YwqE